MYPTIPDTNDPRVITDAAEKIQRVRDWISKNDLGAVIISRRDQFAWLTNGGDNHVLKNSEHGVGVALITPTRQYLLAHSMDAARLHEEQVAGQGYELITLRWFEGEPTLRALALAGSGRVAADTCVPGAQEAHRELSYLHYPLTELELDRCRWLGRAVDAVLHNLALTIAPGQTEDDIARVLHATLIVQGITPDVLIVGSDERVSRYRHPLPTRKPVRKYVLLHPAARRWGLHANVTRSLYFGTPPDELRRAYDAAASVEARILGCLQAGLPFAEILARQKEWYAAAGRPDEWQYHFQGGPTGYLVADTGRNQTDTHVQIDQAYDWFVTVTGAKVEELTLLTEAGVEIASSGSGWPMAEYQNGPQTVAVPGLLIK